MRIFLLIAWVILSVVPVSRVLADEEEGLGALIEPVKSEQPTLQPPKSIDPEELKDIVIMLAQGFGGEAGEDNGQILIHIENAISCLKGITVQINFTLREFSYFMTDGSEPKVSVDDQIRIQALYRILTIGIEAGMAHNLVSHDDFSQIAEDLCKPNKFADLKNSLGESAPTTSDK